MSFKTVSAILGSTWLISDDYVQANLGLVAKMLQGETVDFGLKKEKDTEPKVILVGAGHTGLAGAIAAAISSGPQAAAVYGVSSYTKLENLPAGSIAQVDIIGPVLKYGDACSDGMTDHAAVITKLANQGNISAIILNIDSPGGQASGTTLLADAIKAASQVKPVVAVIQDGIAASAGMWIASAASEIYVTNNTSKVGSIGVFTTLADWYGYAKKQGLEIRDIYAPQSTDKNGEHRQALAGNDAPMLESLGDLADAFMGTIQANRAGKLTSEAWNTGKMFDGKKATKMGLIDGVKSYSQVVQRVEKMISTKSSIKSNTYNMNAFMAIMAAAAISEIAVVEGGFLLTEENLTAIENILAENQAAQATHADAISALNAQLAEKETALAAAGSVDHVATIADLNEQLAAKEAEISTLKAAPAAAFTGTTASGDHQTSEIGTSKHLTSYDVEMQRLMELKEKK